MNNDPFIREMSASSSCLIRRKSFYYSTSIPYFQKGNKFSPAEKLFFVSVSTGGNGGERNGVHAEQAHLRNREKHAHSPGRKKISSADPAFPRGDAGSGFPHSRTFSLKKLGTGTFFPAFPCYSGEIY